MSDDVCCRCRTEVLQKYKIAQCHKPVSTHLFCKPVQNKEVWTQLNYFSLLQKTALTTSSKWATTLKPFCSANRLMVSRLSLVVFVASNTWSGQESKWKLFMKINKINTNMAITEAEFPSMYVYVQFDTKRTEITMHHQNLGLNSLNTLVFFMWVSMSRICIRKLWRFKIHFIS